MYRGLTITYSGLLQGMLVLSVMIASKVIASEFPPIFYPLQMQSQGQYLPAKKLNMGQQGGLWSFDVHDQLRFFDGSRFVAVENPPFEASSSTFSHGQFWYYRNHSVYAQVPTGNERHVYDVDLINTISKVGASKDYLWFVDEVNIYLYSMGDKRVTEVSLQKFEPFHSGLTIDVSDAILVHNTWYFATSVGVFAWDNHVLSRVKLSTSALATTLYYSTDLNQLIVGYTTGAEIYSLSSSQSQYFGLARSHVLTIDESEQYIWLGTEHGLYLVDKRTKQASKVEVNPNDEYGLMGEKIYSLARDGTQGMWIATNSGVRYFSEYDALFRRFSVTHQEDLRRVDTKLDMFDNPLGGYWVVTNNGLYSINNDGLSTLVFWGQVSSVAQRGKTLWLATERGLLSLDLGRYRVASLMDEFPTLPAEIDHLSFRGFDNDDDTLWVSSGLRVLAIDLSNHTLRDFGQDWILKKHLPAKITSLKALTNKKLAVGTDHGLYLIDKDKSHYVNDSESFGRVIEMTDTREGLWAVSSYGVFNYHLLNQVLTPIALPQNNIRPVCVTQSKEAIWLITSRGVSAHLHTGALLRELSEPYGVINNEFIDGSCAYNQDTDAVAVGSRYGIVEFTSDEVLSASYPTQTVLITELRVDNQPVSIGMKPSEVLRIPYGESISARFGVWPFSSGQTVEYRFDGDEDWTPIQGLELSLDKPAEGTHQLSVRVRGDESTRRLKSFQFVVLTPWYKSIRFYAFSVVMLLVVIIWGVLWRSRRVTAINKMLKTQVSLKTEQLQHQSRVLIRSNQQLRKVFHVRQEVVRDLVKAAMDASKQNVWYREYQEKMHRDNKHHDEPFNNLEAVFNKDSQRSPVCSVSAFIYFSVKAWQQEFDSHGVRINLGVLPSQSKVILDDCNLDIIFNSVLASALKRLVRGQVMDIIVDVDRTKLSVIFEDSGLPFPSVNRAPEGFESTDLEKVLDFSPSRLPMHIHNSGGELLPIERGELNRVVIRWNLYSENSVATIENQPLFVPPSPVTNTSPTMHDKTSAKHDDWKTNVIQLVAEQCTHAEFSTSSAAKALFISERSLQRRFKSLFGVTFSDYLSEVRMEKACEMLLQGDKVADVAFACGFNDPSYFSQRFKLYFGVSPSKFVLLDNDESS
ncbi:helix-turn-helix domain-containing protein [Vibrio sp. E150_011]